MKANGGEFRCWIAKRCVVNVDKEKESLEMETPSGSQGIWSSLSTWMMTELFYSPPVVKLCDEPQNKGLGVCGHVEGLLQDLEMFPGL